MNFSPMNSALFDAASGVSTGPAVTTIVFLPDPSRGTAARTGPEPSRSTAVRKPFGT